jgi:hypothetical protein
MIANWVGMSIPQSRAISRLASLFDNLIFFRGGYTYHSYIWVLPLRVAIMHPDTINEQHIPISSKKLGIVER